MTTQSSEPWKLDQAGRIWFGEVKNLYLTVKPAIANPTPAQTVATAEIDKILTVAPAELTQQSLFDLEDLVVMLLPSPDLKQWVYAKRDDYREVFGLEAMERLARTLVPQVSAATDADLQAEARRLHQELHWQSCVQPWAQRKKRELMVGILKVTGFLVGSMFLVYWICVWIDNLQIAALIFFLGAIGGCISVIQRVQTADLANSRALNNARYSQTIISVAIAPLQGAIFSMLFALVLAAGMTPAGFVMPKVALQASNATNAPVTLLAGGPINPGAGAGLTTSGTQSITLAPQAGGGKAGTPGAGTAEQKPSIPNPVVEYKCSFPFFEMWLCFGDGKDVALFLLWAFLAGFSERLVPDVLSRIADKGKA